MGLFSRHIDARLVDWSAGDLGPWRTGRMLAHARSCARCKGLLDRVLLAHRVLEGSLLQPSEEELSLWSANARSVVAAVAPEPAPGLSRGWLLALAGATVAGLLLLLVPRPAPQPEWAARGDRTQQRAAVRVYCAPAGGEVAELSANEPCAGGNSLGFAVGARPPLRRVRITVTLGTTTLASQEAAVAALPGAEEVLPVSVDLPASGMARVEVVFAEEAGDFDRSPVRFIRDVPVGPR
jgi:hypothetical protein